MATMAGTNRIVFRDDPRQVSRNHIAASITAAIVEIRPGQPDSALDALVLAGQLESALYDCASYSADLSSAWTDSLARFMLGISAGIADSDVSTLLGNLPASIRISEPEGFSYYALHPGDFADVMASLASVGFSAIIGIRSIGTTLSAVAMAQFEKLGTPVSRITVRPVGHPYDRKTNFTPSQLNWIERHDARGATFLVLDEGPGLSGSSFLSVAEGLVEQGIAATRIVLVGTRDCDPEQLCTPGAALRWRKFAWRKVGSRIQKRFSSLTPLGGGAWRDVLLPSTAERPASWKEMETPRFLAPDRKQILKFEGFGQAGGENHARAQALHKARFGPAVERVGDGMNAYQFIQGQCLSRMDLSSALIDHMAQYCAFRLGEFASSRGNARQLQEMAEFNFRQETGRSLDLPKGTFETDRPVLIDGRMHPHEWIRSTDGKLWKVDAVQHGDDHFQPGPTDIAWDLAGAIVEWDMRGDAAQYLEARFRYHTGRAANERLPYFVLAYSIFRACYCRMAAQASSDPAERARLERFYQFYRRKAETAETAVHQLKL